jgi:hypothetical protein
LTTYVKKMVKVDLSLNLLVQAIPMCLSWVATTLWDRLMQVGLQLTWWQEGETTFCLQINTIAHWARTNGKLASYFSNALFSLMLMSGELGRDEFIVIFLMTNDMTSLLEISLDVHIYTLSPCWQLFWVAVGHMCNVNMCIMSCKGLCYVGSRKSSFITTMELGWSSTFVDVF